MTSTLALALLVLGARETAHDDTVQTSDGRVFRGTIQEDTAAQVRIRPERGRPETIPGDEVDRVIYDDAPAEFVTALAAIEGGQYGTGAQQIGEIMAIVQQMRANPRSHPNRVAPRDWFESYAFFHLGEARRLAADYDGALDSYRTIFDTYADFRMIRQAYVGAMSCYVSSNDEAGAQALLERVRGEASRLGQGFIDQVNSRYLDLLMTNNPRAARTEFMGLLRSDDPAVVLDSVRKILQTYRAEDEDPASFCGQIMADASMSAGARMLCAVTLGEARLQAARESRSEADYREAVDALLAAVIVHFPGKGAGLDAEHRDGLSALATAYEALIGLAGSEEGRNFYRREASRTYRQIIALYPSSTEAGEAAGRAAEIEASIVETDPRQ